MKNCAIVVTFRPDIAEFRTNLEQLKTQVNKVFVIDNTPNQDPIYLELQKLLSQETFVDFVQIVQNGKNLGIAKALNQGISLALEQKFDYISTFDQDSQAENGMILNLLNFIENSTNKFIIVSPESTDKFETTKHLERPELVDKTITSGMTFAKVVIEKCGLMNEKLFIDYVDFEFCLRFQKMQGNIYTIPGPKLRHSLGDLSEFKFLNKTFWPTNHSAFRRYFITRNRIFVWIKYFRFFPKWVLRDIKFFVIETLLILLAEKDKLNKVLAILAGSRDVVFNRYG